MQQNFYISVIVPTFNSQKYIGRCLRSLKNQSLSKKNYEIIVIDDCSSDNSLKKIEKFIGAGNYEAQYLDQEEVDEILGR